MKPEPEPIDLHHRLWASACTIAAELEERVISPLQPLLAHELRFNGGVAPQVGIHYARILASADLPDNARILDLGCGFGRIAMALAGRLGEDVQYVGLDPNADGIAWAQRNITARHPNFQFRRIDIKSRPYNPDGTKDGSVFRFPFEDESLDLVFMISVLTHVDLATVENYLRESARVLKSSGRLVATIFLLDDEVESLLAAGKSHFALKFRQDESRVENLANPELVIAHPRQRVMDMLDRADFAKSVIVNGHWSGRPSVLPMDFQDMFIAGRSAEAVLLPDARQTMPVDGMTQAQQAVYERVMALTGGEEVRLAQFIGWANALTINAFWWRCDGYKLSLGQGEPAVLQFDALRKLQLDEVRPGDGIDRKEFHMLDDVSIIALLIRSGRASGHRALFDAMVEAADNGLRVLDAISAGAVPVLRDQRGGETPAMIPRWV